MNSATIPQTDPLETFGLAILEVDTRWVIVGAICFVAIFLVVLRMMRSRSLSREESVSLGVAVLQLYSAPVLLAMLVLTQPPAVDRVSAMQRQSAGLLAFIFLVGGVFQQIKKFWYGDEQNEQTDESRRDTTPPPPATSKDAKQRFRT